MRIAIIAKSGPAAGRRIVLRGGQVARVGRTDWADFALPEDLELADIHFAVHCSDNTAMVHVLAKDRDTRINGGPLDQSEMKHGDVIIAGATLFQIEIEGGARLAVEPTDGGLIANEESNRNEALEIANYIGLSDESIEMARSSIDPKRFGTTLVQSGRLTDALRWYAHTIPKPQAVLWACACVEENMQTERHSVQLAAYRAALRWAKEPSDDHREDAKQLAEMAKHEGIAGVLAASAGWSGGSLGPSNVPEVPPDDRLTARCVCIALTLADALGDPASKTERLLGYLNRLRSAPHPKSFP